MPGAGSGVMNKADRVPAVGGHGQTRGAEIPRRLDGASGNETK